MAYVTFASYLFCDLKRTIYVLAIDQPFKCVIASANNDKWLICHKMLMLNINVAIHQVWMCFHTSPCVLWGKGSTSTVKKSLSKAFWITPHSYSWRILTLCWSSPKDGKMTQKLLSSVDQMSKYCIWWIVWQLSFSPLELQIRITVSWALVDSHNAK